ncbi:MAG: hypothetical protein IAF94_25945 [Pirellulaceae bacterium]|nr:hypothetical protein [Pirellulaceae bacterium]
MLRPRYRKAVLWLSLGLLLGLATGLAVHVGLENRPSAGGFGLPLEELKLRASASHGSETFAMATGMLDDTEGVFMLDYLTGDLTCFALNSRQPAKFYAMFHTNVWQELPVEKGKKPTYVMCTGAWSYRGGTSGGGKAAECVVYVADCNTGGFVAYSVVVNGAKGSITALDGGKARDLKLRQ